ncbi:Methyltransferase domain-containing protein [Bacillus sp. OV322]|uniref:class I SAM-dependent methyltransferase n=1 Tax=Bacillus sp. OV322 TaxID=1882764 RepID=UPI0008E52E10|nr:class I SAM-dependent methyltransferase [Bacillus sp. OV322]SFC19749.1 Methyltransferase domain-containing protein [Bacillus sp. OV322]
MEDNTYYKGILHIGSLLNHAGIPYEFTGASALLLQGVILEDEDRITVSVQWDLLQQAYSLFETFQPSELVKTPEKAEFYLKINQIEAVISFFYNTTVKTDPYRIAIQHGGEEIWCRSLYSHLYDKEMNRFSSSIHAHLLKQQQGFTEHNEQAWNQNNYLALINRYGRPEDMAEKIRQNPAWRLHPFYKYLGDLNGKKVAHLMGSNGVKAAALALLGAEVTVADFSKENKAFAEELAASCGVDINYIVSDVLSLPQAELGGKYDLVLMELGVLHYVIDLQPLAEVIRALLKKGGRFVLHEFHPISTKLISSSGKKHKVTGNYFDPEIENNRVAFTKHMPEQEQESLSNVVQRKWTIGELITAIGQSGLVIKVLEEEPNHKIHDIGLPKTYTLVCEKTY